MASTTVSFNVLSLRGKKYIFWFSSFHTPKSLALDAIKFTLGPVKLAAWQRANVDDVEMARKRREQSFMEHQILEVASELTCPVSSAILIFGWACASNDKEHENTRPFRMAHLVSEWYLTPLKSIP